jgi:hypothetical protein
MPVTRALHANGHDLVMDCPKNAATSARLITERPCVQIAAGPSFYRAFVTHLEICYHEPVTITFIGLSCS